MTVAVAYSETDRGRMALREAANEAVRRGSRLAVLRIIAGVDEPQQVDPALVEQVAKELVDFPDLSWQVHSAPEGTDTAEALVDLAAEVEASVLVIGSRRRTPVGKWLLGSTVQRVLMEATTPVLVVRAP